MSPFQCIIFEIFAWFLQHEIGLCRKEQPFEIKPNRMDSSMDFQPDSPPLAMETDTVVVGEVEKPQGSEESTSAKEEPEPSTSSQKPLPDYSAAKTGRLRTIYFLAHLNHIWYVALPS